MAVDELTDTDRWSMVRAERIEILDLLRGLNRHEWETASLCAGWRVRDVAAHLLIDAAVEDMGRIRFVAKFVRNGRSVDKLNEWWVARNADVSTASIVDRFEQSLEPGWLSRRVGSSNQLRASVIHHQDMRRPLGLPRSIPPERRAAVLDAVLSKTGSGGLGSIARAEGLGLEATDIDWRHGSGPAVRGPGEAILMSLAGRNVALGDLSGDGFDVLGSRS